MPDTATLLERDGQLARLVGALAPARRGYGAVAVLLGEAGAGKTALTEAFLRQAGDGPRILRSACEDLSIPDPLGPLYDLAREAGWTLPRDGDGAGRVPLFSEALGVFDSPARPTVVVIEDLHWADDATLDLVRFLGRRIANSHILLLVTARNDGADNQKRVRRALGDIPADYLVRIDVPLLSEAAVSALAGQAGQDGHDIYAATAGNAFFVTEWLRAGAGPVPPPSVRDAVLARAELLSPPARSVLDLVSIFPRHAPHALLSRLGASEEGAAGCVEAGVLIDTPAGYAFRHELARRAIEMAMPVAQRRRLNAQLLSALRDSPDIAVARLVHHAVEAQDIAAIRQFAPQAARAASRMGAHREAAGYYRTLLDQTGTLSDAELADLHENYAFECHVTGRIQDAIASQDIARRLHRQGGDRRREGTALRWLSRLSWLAGDRDGAERYGEEAMRRLEATPGAELAMACSNLAQLAMLADNAVEAAAYGEKAIALAGPLGRMDIICHACNNVGTAQAWQDPVACRANLDRALQIALDGEFHEEAARAYTNRSCIELEWLDLAAGETWLEAGLAYCVERDLDTWRAYMTGHLASALIYRGQWDAAAERALSVVTQDQATPLMRFPSVVALALLRIRRGDPASEPLLAELERFVGRAAEFSRLAAYACLQAERAWMKDEDPAAALALIGRAEGLSTSPGAAGRLAFWRQVLAPGSVPAAAAGTRPTPYTHFVAGDWRGAACLWNDIGAPYEQALCLIHGDEAAQIQAVAIADRLGARPVASHMRRIMRRNGATRIPREPFESGLDRANGLTERENAVLDLICAGQSNKGIARTLNISPKTVDHHVSAVLRKLDVASRSEAVAHVHQSK